MSRLREAQLRHAAHYLAVLMEADKSYYSGGEMIERGLDLFDLEWSNIREGQSYAERYANEVDQAATLCSNYPYWGAYILALRQPTRERVCWLESALIAAQRLKDRAAEGRHIGRLGVAHFDLGEMRQSIFYHDQALAIDIEAGDLRGQCETLINLGNAYGIIGETRHAISLYEQALILVRKLGEPRYEGPILGNLGLAFFHLGEYELAIQLQEQSLSIARELGDHLAEGNSLNNLGIVYARKGDHHRAIFFYEQRLVIARQIGDRRGEGETIANLASSR
ncbi:MAG: tetratricopeptide repeat protein, partial [Acidobacteria bacterium]|nr:tetratricopeptide repeat protein [Acidobacteriota bacterium]